MYGKIISMFNPQEDYHIIKLEVGEDYFFEPGQFTKFSLPSSQVKSGSNFRIFSIANSKPDGTLVIATRTGDSTSDFKKLLLSLKKGDEIEIAKPMGSFTLKDSVTPMVMYAGGIGITPIRSIIGAIKDQTSRKFHLVYSSAEYYLFGEELKEIAANNEMMELCLTTTFHESMNRLSELCKEYGNSAYYYTSGAPMTISSIEEEYIKHDIDKLRLFSDKFVGY